MISRFTDPLISILYPQSCLSCGGQVEHVSDGAACRACWEATTVFAGSDPLCEKCGLPLDSMVRNRSLNCGQCGDHQYDRAFAAGIYEKAFRASVLHSKQEPHISRTAAVHLLAAFDRVHCDARLLIVPVPLSRQRQLERGFNQAVVLARIVAKHARLPLDDQSLTRVRDTPMHRAAMDAKAREATVTDVFAVKRPRLINGRDILLIEDLMTSGATVSHCARALKKNGAGRVFVLTLARAVLN